MKNLTCLPKFLFKTRFVFMGFEEQINQAIERYKPKDNTELVDYTQVEAQAKNAIEQRKQQIIDSLNTAHETAATKEESNLNAINRDTPQGNAEYAKKKKEFDANQKRRADELEQTEAALNTAATAALNSLRQAYNDAEKKRKDAADEFAKSIASEVMNAQRSERQKEVGNAVNNLMNSSGLDSSLFQDGLTLPRYIKNTRGQLEQAQNDANDKPITPWNKDSVRLATYEMLKAIYMEQGPEAAKKKANELMQATREQGANGKVDMDPSPEANDNAIDNTMSDLIAGSHINPQLATAIFVNDTLAATETEEKEAHGMVNQASWNKAFDGAVDHVLKDMQFDPNRGAELFGMVVGNISAAKELFKGNNSVLKRYEAAVRNAVERGLKPFPTPTAWAKDNAPEVFVTPDKPEAFVDKILEAYTIPNDVNHEAAVAKRDQVRAMLIGVLSATNDTTKWDSLAREALKTMIGENWDVNKINQANPTEIMKDREIYGQSADKLDDTAKAYISGLIFGAEQEFKDKKIPIIDADKNQTSIGDFIETYKSIVTDMLKTNQVIQSNIDALYEEMLTQVANNNPTSNQEKAEIARIESYYQQQIYDYLKHSLPTPQKVWEEYQQKNKSASDAIPPPRQTVQTPGRKKKRGNSDVKVPSTLATTPTAGAPSEPSAASTTAPPASESKGAETRTPASTEPPAPAAPATPQVATAPTAATAPGAASDDSSNDSSSSNDTPTTSTKEATRANPIRPLQTLLDTAQKKLNPHLSSGEGSDATYKIAWDAYLAKQGAALRNELPAGQPITLDVSNKKVTLTKQDDGNVTVQVETIPAPHTSSQQSNNS